MIERDDFGFNLYCDICGEETEKQFDDFYEAVDYKKNHGWKSQRNSRGEWLDVCPSCKER